MLSKCISNNIAKENYLCNIGPEHTDMFLYENNLRNVHLICLGQQCTKWLPAQCRQCSPTVHCLVNVFQIRMRQNCTRKLLVQYSPRVHRYTFTGKPTASNISGGLFCNQVHHHRTIFIQNLFNVDSGVYSRLTEQQWTVIDIEWNMWIFASPEIFEKPVTLECFFFIPFPYYENSLFPCFGNRLDFCFTQTHKFEMSVFSHAFPIL